MTGAELYRCYSVANDIEGIEVEAWDELSQSYRDVWNGLAETLSIDYGLKA